MKAAGRASGALSEPPSPHTEETSTGKAECSDSEATESDLELERTNDVNDAAMQENTQALADKEKDLVAAPAPQTKPKLRMPECPPKTFDRARNISKGTLQLFSPCGAKIGSFEMVKSESMTMLFTVLSKIMPFMSQALRELREHRGMNIKNVRVWNAATKRRGTAPTNV